MYKKEFLLNMRRELKDFSRQEIDRVILYYDELISDKMDMGQTEQSVIAELGDVKAISRGIKADLAISRLEGNEGNKKVGNSLKLVLKLFAAPAMIPLGIIFSIAFLVIAITGTSLIAGFGVATIAIAIAVIPTTILAISQAGIGTGIVVASVLTILIGVFGLISVLFLKYGIAILNFMLKMATRVAKKIYS